MDSSVERFISSLYAEKLLHKEHRNKHVLHKLLISSSFFGLGQLSSNQVLFHLFLYAVPLICLVHDMYILAEDFKVKRVGRYLVDITDGLRSPNLAAYIHETEREWELKWLPEHRETHAFWASLAYTVIISAFSALAIYRLEFQSDWRLVAWYSYTWAALCATSAVAVFLIDKSLHLKLEFKSRHDQTLSQA